MWGWESESDVRFSVTPFFEVPKIEHRRFSSFPCNKKPVLTSFRVNEGRGIRIHVLRSSLVTMLETTRFTQPNYI